MIIFKKIRYKNFLSTGNRFIEVNLNKHKTTLMVGKNGSGKSTILDAITFSLFGKPFRNINKPELLNHVNGKDCVVEVEFEIGTNKYLVRRGIKPAIFDIIINGTQINRDADALDFQKYLENTILKLNYKSFTQIVILGSSSFIPFMQLPAGERRVIIEDILDITIFSSMNSILKENISVVKDEIKKHESANEVIKGKIQVQEEHIERLKDKQKNAIEGRQQKIDEAKETIRKHQESIGNINKQIEVLSDSISDEAKIVGDIEKYSKNYDKGMDFVSREKKEAKFFNTHDSCHVCQQSIDENFKVKKIQEKMDSIKIAEENMKAIESRLEKARQREKEIRDVIIQINALNKQIQHHNTEITSMNYMLSNMSSEQIDDSDIKDEQLKLDAFIDEQKKIIESKHEQEKELFIHEAAQGMLKDTGVKAKIIKQYLPVINKLINKYLKDLNFYVTCVLNENFKEEIKSRNQHTLSYGGLSEGQKLRIDLALLFTWREIARMKNSVNTNLLFLDEIFDSSLDIEGTEEFLKLLKATDNSYNVFMISHKTDQLLDKFQSVLKFELKGNFTTMKSS